MPAVTALSLLRPPATAMQYPSTGILDPSSSRPWTMAKQL